MKILMVLEKDFPPDLRVENEIKSLIKAGHQVILACFTFTGDHRNEIWNTCKIYKKRISPFQYKSSVGALKFPFYFQFWRKHLEEIIRLESPDAIHIHDLPLARLGSEIKQKYRLRFTLDLHENWPAFLRISKHANTFMGRILSSNAQWEKYEIHSCHQADQIIVVIDEAKERLINIGIPKNKIHIVANYPVLADFDKLPFIKKEGKQKILFYAGGIGEHRGLQYVIRAIPAIIKDYPDIKLKILGEGNYRPELEKIVKDLEVEPWVEFTGQVPYKIVLEELAKADITLIPHEKSEHTDSTIPHKLFQYMYAGKPVISSNCRPIERIIKSSGAGYVYLWNSPDEFAAVFFVSLKNKNFSADKIKSEVERNYSWEAEQKKLITIYNKQDQN